jgi:hypothetical protein
VQKRERGGRVQSLRSFDKWNDAYEVMYRAPRSHPQISTAKDPGDGILKLTDCEKCLGCRVLAATGWARIVGGVRPARRPDIGPFPKLHPEVRRRGQLGPVLYSESRRATKSEEQIHLSSEPFCPKLVLASIQIPGNLSTCSPAIAVLARTRQDHRRQAKSDSVRFRAQSSCSLTPLP